MADIPSGKFRHRKSGGEYEVIGFAYIEKDRVEAVVYRSVENGLWWVRPLSEFMDGRFEQLPRKPHTQDSASIPAETGLDRQNNGGVK